VHLIHPRPVLWRDLAQAIAQERQLPVAPFKEWFKALHALIDDDERGAKDMKTLYPLLRILPYAEPFIMYASNTAPLVDATAVPLLDMANALRLSPTLRDPEIRRLDRTAVRNWLRHLGLLPAIRSPQDRRHLARL
jgi:hypothetical protein